MQNSLAPVVDVLEKHKDFVRENWISELLTGLAGGSGRTSDEEIRHQTDDFLNLLLTSLQNDPSGNTQTAAWDPIRKFLEDLSASRALAGYTSVQTATFIFSFKKPLFAALTRESGNAMVPAWAATDLLDQLGLITVAAFQKTRENVIARQSQEMLELSTPVVKLWDGVLALPMIGTLDSSRTQVVMETLLERIVETGSQIAILDITGVPTVDTLVAQHLLKAVTAIRLMGADCIVSGVRPQIAQTIVHLGIDLSEVTTKATLADALALALRRSGYNIHKRSDDSK